MLDWTIEVEDVDCDVEPLVDGRLDDVMVVETLDDVLVDGVVELVEDGATLDDDTGGGVLVSLSDVPGLSVTPPISLFDSSGTLSSEESGGLDPP